MRCRVCGSNNEDGSKFCWNCGNKLTEQSETRSSSVNQPGIQQNSGDVQHNQVGTPPKQVRMPQRQVPPGGFDWENGKKMAEERLQKGKNIADGCVGQLKRVAENQTITDKLKKISKKTWGIIGACVALVLVLLIVIALHKPTVNLNDSLTEDAGYYVDQYNKAPSVLEKEYKVKNLGKYLSKIKEVDTDGMNSARAKAQKSISDMVDYWSEDVTLDKVSYAGDYLQVAKDSDDYTKNYYGVIYQINAHIQPDGGQRKDVVSYYSMKFENVIVGGDGKCEIDLDEYDVPYDDFSVEVTSGDLSSGSYSFDGYQTLEELKKNYVDEVADEFDCEWDVSGKLEAVDLGVTSDYLCSYSSDRLLTDSDVEGYLNANYSEYNFPEGINIIQMIINEIYAKHGYEFTDSKLSAYFSNKTWYKSNTNKVNDMNAVSDSMSEIEKKNVDFLNSYR